MPAELPYIDATNDPAALSRTAKDVVKSRKRQIVKVGDNELVAISPVETEDIWADYDPKRVQAAIKKHAGMLTKDEAEKMIVDLHAAREAGSRPVDKF